MDARHITEIFQMQENNKKKCAFLELRSPRRYIRQTILPFALWQVLKILSENRPYNPQTFAFSGFEAP